MACQRTRACVQRRVQPARNCRWLSQGRRESQSACRGFESLLRHFPRPRGGVASCASKAVWCCRRDYITKSAPWERWQIEGARSRRAGQPRPLGRVHRPGHPRNRQAPRLRRLTPSASDSMTAARTAEDITICRPCAAKQMPPRGRRRGRRRALSRAAPSSNTTWLNRARRSGRAPRRGSADDVGCANRCIQRRCREGAHAPSR